MVAPGSVVLIRISRIFLQKYGIVSVVKPGSDHRVAPVSCIGKMLLGIAKVNPYGDICHLSPPSSSTVGRLAAYACGII